MTTTELTQKIDEAQAAVWAVKGAVQDIQEVGRRENIVKVLQDQLRAQQKAEMAVIIAEYKRTGVSPAGLSREATGSTGGLWEDEES